MPQATSTDGLLWLELFRPSMRPCPKDMRPPQKSRQETEKDIDQRREIQIEAIRMRVHAAISLHWQTSIQRVIKTDDRSWRAGRQQPPPAPMRCSPPASKRRRATRTPGQTADAGAQSQTQIRRRLGPATASHGSHPDATAAPPADVAPTSAKSVDHRIARAITFITTWRGNRSGKKEQGRRI